MKFSYIKLPSQKGRFIELPLIKIGLAFGSYLCLVDSGADFCHFHGQIGETLGLKVKKGRIAKGRGITGKEFTNYFHKVKINIGGWKYEVEVGFSYELGTPFGILGREGFFNLSKVCFNHSKREIELKN